MSPSDPNYSPPQSRGPSTAKRRGPFGIPIRSNDPDAEDAAKGSFAAGFGLGWLIMIGSVILGAVLLAANAGALLQFLFPGTLGVLAASAIGFAIKGRGRVAKGVVAAFGSLIALVLLLMAACFGLVMIHR